MDPWRDHFWEPHFGSAAGGRNRGPEMRARRRKFGDKFRGHSVEIEMYIYYYYYINNALFQRVYCILCTWRRFISIKTSIETFAHKTQKATGTGRHPETLLKVGGQRSRRAGSLNTRGGKKAQKKHKKRTHRDANARAPGLTEAKRTTTPHPP